MYFVDMHCDTVSELQKKRERGEKAQLLQNDLHVDLIRMKKSGYLVQNFALFVQKEKCPNPWICVQNLLTLYEEEMEKNQEIIGRVFRYQDIEKNQRAGKMSALLTVEEGAVCQGEIAKLLTLYEQGVRMMTLTWNFPNEIGYPSKEVEKGLTEKGREFVCKMQEIGMIIDVSHLSDQGFYDVLDITRKPFAASHSNARSLCNHTRNMTDEMIRALAERGGVMGLNFYPDFLVQVPSGKKNPGTIADIVQHAEHIVRVGGEECLGLGSDFDGIDGHGELTGVQDMEKLADALRKHRFTPSQVDKILWKNVLRLYHDLL